MIDDPGIENARSQKHSLAEHFNIWFVRMSAWQGKTPCDHIPINHRLVECIWTMVRSSSETISYFRFYMPQCETKSSAHESFSRGREHWATSVSALDVRFDAGQVSDRLNERLLEYADNLWRVQVHFRIHYTHSIDVSIVRSFLLAENENSGW